MTDQIVSFTGKIVAHLAFKGAPEEVITKYGEAVAAYQEWRDIQAENAQFQMDQIDDKETP